ncbi:REP13E12 repeat protein [Mycobacterium tuberculosis]|nr:REP13E12 repeat protein [Mycobacterium tuberculosis]
MGSGSRERIVEVFDALDAELDRLDEVSFEVLTTPERLRSLERLECLVRRLPAVGHALINQLDAQASEEELGGTLCCALANRLRITKPDAARRIADAADLGPRRALTGEPLAPQLTATATAQRQGLIGEAHIKVIRALFRPPARRGGCVHPPGRRSRPGRQSRSISSRRAGPLRPAGHGLATPRRRPHRHRTRPQTRHHPEQPAIRRHVTAKWLPDPPSAGHFGSRASQTGRPRRDQPRRPHPGHRHHPRCGRHRPRHPQPSPTQPRRAAGRAARADRLRETGPTQRSSRLDRGHHHPDRPANRRRQGLHRRRHPATHGRCDPHDQPRPPLLPRKREVPPGDLRPRHTPGAVSHQTPSLPGPADHAVRQRPRLHQTRL